MAEGKGAYTPPREAGAGIWAGQGPALAAVVLFSSVVNLLLLTGPLYMLQVYDRVLSSRSEPTLVALSAIVLFLFVVLGALDHLRARILARIGATVQARLDRLAFPVALRARAAGGGPAEAALTAPADAQAIRAAIASPLALALCDLPWAPVFLTALFIFHPLLGQMALAGGGVILALTIAGHRAGRRAAERATAAGGEADRLAHALRTEAETILSLGMTGAALDRWTRARDRALDEGLRAADKAGLFGAGVRSLRMIMQSAILGAAAWLVLQGSLGAGAMIAASVLMGRVLQPVEQIAAHWATGLRAVEARRRLATLLIVPWGPPPLPLPRPRAELEVEGLTLFPPGQPVAALRMVGFSLRPGQALGVIGPSGAGKSTLARAVAGVWPAQGGTIRLGRATLDRYGPDDLGRLIGYLPQRVTLFDGTVAENIARLATPPDSAGVIAAARRADVHEMILRLPQGYDTRIEAGQAQLSGGQVQRIGLARALYGDPVLLVLDEPNSNLDADGGAALSAAIRAQKAAGGAVLIMAHRPAAIRDCDLILMLERGQRRAFGPRDQVLAQVLQVAPDLPLAGGAA